MTASNSGTLPANGATGTIEWLGNAPPFNAYEIPASGALSLIYTATVDPMTPDGFHLNSASSFVDQVQTGPTTATVTVGRAVYIDILYFSRRVAVTFKLYRSWGPTVLAYRASSIP